MSSDGTRVFVVSDFGEIRFDRGLFFLELQEDFFVKGETGGTVREIVLSPSSFLDLFNNIDASVRKLAGQGEEVHGNGA